jgi:phosphate transport system substrate-binding protein
MVPGRRVLYLVAVAVTAVALATAVGDPAAAEAPIALRGAGATFPAPLYYKWAETFARSRPELRITYDSVGSGDGITRFVAGTVDFGASDAGIPDQEAAKVTRGALLVPGTAGMVALAYNLPGLGGPLRLPRAVYADILLGKIKHWNDPRLKAANPDLKLPDRTIAVVGRLDRSGTTFALTSHLSAVSEAWKSGPGAATLVEWPASAMLARGNEGVASRIKISEGSIGYVEYGFAKRLGLPLAEIENKSGRFVSPSEASGQSALAEATRAAAESARLVLTDPTAADAYPMVTMSWLLLYKQYPDEKTRMALKSFISWGLTEGQALARDLGFLPLPEVVAARGKTALDAIR